MKHSLTVPVLMYHHVSPVDGMINVTPSNFEEQLLWLKRPGYRSLSRDEFAAHLDGKPAPATSALITFDDGSLDNGVYAYPMHKQHSYTAMALLVHVWIAQRPFRTCP